MADVTISSLPLGTPSGSGLIPYSSNNTTYGASISSIINNSVISGVWTPYIDSRDGQGSPTISYTINEGKYYRIGDLVQFYGWLRGIPSNRGDTTRQLVIFGLPFDAPSTYTVSPISIGSGSGFQRQPRAAIVYGYDSPAPSAAVNKAKIIIRRYYDGGAVAANLTDMVLSDITVGVVFDIQFGGTFIAKPL